jgi:hypothetical protein
MPERPASSWTSVPKTDSTQDQEITKRVSFKEAQLECRAVLQSCGEHRMTAQDCNLRRFHCTGHAAQSSSAAEHHRIFPRFVGWLAMYIALGCTAVASRPIHCADSAYSAALVRAWRDWRGTFELSRESDGRHAVVQVAPA